ncbi:MAG: glycosyltransferase family 1 protein [Pseudomonadota bacterium]
MRITLVSDAWYPQINGVVRTLNRVREELEALDHQVTVIAPSDFKTIPCPTYPEIRLALRPGKPLAAKLEESQPQAIHLPTEGPLGLAARSYCRKRGLPFTTSYHTRFPEYISARAPVPVSWGYRFMRWFHGGSSGVMVATPSLKRDLEGRGFTNLRQWSRGVDLTLFRPEPPGPPPLDLPKPVFLYVGRVAVEKNIEAFLKLDLPGSKLVVGDGPQLASLRKSYPEVHFAGAKVGEELARHYALGDVFVFPSRTDTFGLVLLEAMASGLPVAAYPVTGPLDVVGGSGAGVLDEDLAKAAKAALELDPKVARAYAERFSWRACAEQFRGFLAPFA